MILMLKNFVDLTKEEIHLVWKERNKESIRSQMYNTDIIPLESHSSYVASLKDRTDCKYFLVFFDDKAVGVIDFIGIAEDSCEIGDYVFEEFLNLGYGILFETVILKYAFETLNLSEVHCAVLESNENVYKTHVKYFDFSPDKRYSSVKETKTGERRFIGLSLPKVHWQNRHNSTVNESMRLFNVTDIVWK